MRDNTEFLFCGRVVLEIIMIIIIHLFQTHGPYNKHNQWTQYKIWLAILHYRIGVCTRPTLIGAKYFNSAPTTASFAHHNTGIQQLWQRNGGILTLNFKVNNKRKRKKGRKGRGEKNWHTETCKLSDQGFRFFATLLSWDPQLINFAEFLKKDLATNVLLVVCLGCTHCLHTGTNIVIKL